MVKVRITDAGIIQEPGSGFEGSITHVSSATRTASATLTSGDVGVTVMSASQGVLTMTLPRASTSAGSIFVLKSASPSAHIITGSQDVGNTIVTNIVGAYLNVSGVNASAATFPAVTNSSLALMSDGSSWILIGGSGSITFSKGAP